MFNVSFRWMFSFFYLYSCCLHDLAAQFARGPKASKYNINTEAVVQQTPYTVFPHPASTSLRSISKLIAKTRNKQLWSHWAADETTDGALWRAGRSTNGSRKRRRRRRGAYVGQLANCTAVLTAQRRAPWPGRAPNERSITCSYKYTTAAETRALQHCRRPELYVDGHLVALISPQSLRISPNHASLSRSSSNR